jgi:hypothetical protein
MTVTGEECRAYHHRGWLTGNLICTIHEVDIPTVAGSTIVYFGMHLIARLGLPQS